MPIERVSAAQSASAAPAVVRDDAQAMRNPAQVRRVLRPLSEVMAQQRAQAAQAQPGALSQMRSAIDDFRTSAQNRVRISREAAQKAQFYSQQPLPPEDYRLSGAALTRNMAYYKSRVSILNDPSLIRQRAQQRSEPASQEDAAAMELAQGVKSPKPSTGCSTCQSRMYQDGSDDAGVSFQSPQGMPTSLSGVRVASHEGEHATRETAQAREDDRLVTQKKVTMHMQFCPDCGQMYAAGGKTAITTTSRNEENTRPAVQSGEEMMVQTGAAMELNL